jgi:hypothetical protein
MAIISLITIGDAARTPEHHPAAGGFIARPGEFRGSVGGCAGRMRLI